MYNHYAKQHTESAAFASAHIYLCTPDKAQTCLATRYTIGAGACCRVEATWTALHVCLLKLLFSLLPCHACRAFAGMLRSLEGVSLDEVHEYTGVFGSNMRCFMQALTLSSHMTGGRWLSFALASATIEGPEDFAKALLGELEVGV